MGEPRQSSTAGTGVSLISAPDAVEYDLFRLDCAVDALRGTDLTGHGEMIARIQSNLNDLMETQHGYAH